MSQLKLYSADSIKLINWSEFTNGRMVKDLFLPMLEKGVQHYIDNIDTRMYILSVDKLLMPITVNDAQWENSYICSPYTHYITYTKEELRLLNNIFLNIFFIPTINLVGFILKQSKINRVIIINNWLFSTNLYSDLSKSQIKNITSFLKLKFPSYALIFRSLHSMNDSRVLDSFKDNSYRMIPSRKVYYWEPDTNFTSAQRKDLSRDEKIARQTNLKTLRKVSGNYASQVQRLYKLLYINKYSYNNPQYNQNYFKLLIDKNILDFYLLKSKELIGMVGIYRVENIITAPFLGYDTKVDKEVGLFRILQYIIFSETRKQNSILHASSGVGEFKSNRGCKSMTEYMGVYTNHLSKYQIFGWSLLEFVVNKVAKPMVEKYDL